MKRSHIWLQGRRFEERRDWFEERSGEGREERGERRRIHEGDGGGGGERGRGGGRGIEGRRIEEK